MAIITDTLNGGSLLLGTDDNDTISGLAGDDTLLGRLGQDLLLGGDDRDQLIGEGDRDIIRGNNGDDTLFGDDGDDILSGDLGDDILDGGNGNDLLSGDRGNDVLTGGQGNDIFVLRPTTTNPTATLNPIATLDLILDFEDNLDKLGLPPELSFSDLEIVAPADFIGDTTIAVRDTGEFLAALTFDPRRQLNADDFVAIDIIEFSADQYPLREDGFVPEVDEEVDEADAQAMFQTVTLTRSNPSGQTVSVTLTPSDGTGADPTGNATAADYDAAPITVIFGPDEFEKTVTIPIADDDIVESTEIVNLSLSAPMGGATIGDRDTSELAIVDEDIELTVDDVVVLVNEREQFVTLNFSRDGQLDRSATATVSFQDANRQPATFPADYSDQSLPLRFGIGETSASVTLALVNDNLVEGDEQISFQLSDPGELVHFGFRDRGLVGVRDNDTAVVFAQTQYDVAEAAGFVAIELVRQGNLELATQVQLSTTNGSATAGLDFGAEPAIVTFAAGETSQVVSLPIIDDALPEGDELFNLILTAIVGTSIGTPPVARVRIADDDVPDPVIPTPPINPPEPPTLPSIVSFTTASYFTDEDGNTAASITVVRDGNTDTTTSVRLELTPGTATANQDYDNSAIDVIFNPGEILKQIAVPVVDDLHLEASETVNLNLNNVSEGATLGDRRSATLTIAASDPITLDFEEQDNLAPVVSAYRDRGLAFSDNARVVSSAHRLINDRTDTEFGGNFETSASGVNALAYGVGDEITVNIAEGFESQLRFDYASPFVTHNITIFSEENATGSILATTTLPQTALLDFPSAYSLFQSVALPFTGIARSVTFGSVTNKLALDNLQLG